MNALTYSYLALAGAVIFEVFAMAMLQKSKEFSLLVPSVLMVSAFMLSFYLLSVSVKAIPIGIAYAIASGAGIVVLALVGVVFFRQHLDTAAMLGIGLIVSGIVVVNFFSDSIR
ncbi:MAG: multidrug efflux SMR transporter [Alphaproteobacteria bacterium]|nr:multidrug efflux SMR transporter [Alphaproteobacteria bacterium]